MKDFEKGETEMITLTPKMEQAIKQLLSGVVDSDIVDIPGFEQDFVLVRVGSEAQHNMKVQHVLMAPIAGNEDFCVCTKVTK